MFNIDIFENIKIIEMLKSDMLKNVSKLYENMIPYERADSSNEDIFSDILINIYLLSLRLDLDIEKLEKKAVDKIRLKLIEDNERLNSDYHKLCSHFKR